MKRVLMVRYGEIALRGGNRRLFENMLIARIRQNLRDKKQYYVIKEQGRFIIDSDTDFDFEYVIPRVVDIFGIIGVSPCVMMSESDIDTIKAVALDSMKSVSGAKSFKVETRRANKRYPLLSNEVSSEVGGYILENMAGLSVDVHNPEVTLRIEIRNDVYIYSELIKGQGGLPYGSSGKATLLLSGGFDSPVAGFLTAKRGAEIEAVYFHSPPYTSNRAKEKVRALAERLAHYTGSIKLYTVPFTDAQVFMRDKVPPEKLTILLKRAMLKAAEKIAVLSKSLGLVTGDSIGQVASQTMESIFAIDGATFYPVYRPLSGMDKQEIMDMAEEIGTAEISILPYEDCCTIFVADHPETKPKKTIIESIERNMFDELDELLEKAVKEAEIEVIDA